MSRTLRGAQNERRPGTGDAAAATPEAATRDADIAFSMVTDDDASRALWLDAKTAALRSMRAGAVVVERSTLTPGWVAALARHAGERGLEFVEAPVVGSRPQADAGSLVFLAGGLGPVVDRIRPVLARMGSAVHHVGTTPAGAYAKLMVNALFGVQVAALAELLGFAGKAQLDLPGLMQALETLPVLSPSARAAAAAMVARQFAPLFPVELAAKDFRYALAAAMNVGSPLPVVRSVSGVFEASRAQGLKDENLTAIVKLYT